MVRDDIEALLCKPETPALHPGCYHLKGLPGTYNVGKQCIVSIEDMGDRILLVLHQGNLRCHPDESDMGAVILPGAVAVE